MRLRARARIWQPHWADLRRVRQPRTILEGEERSGTRCTSENGESLGTRRGVQYFVRRVSFGKIRQRYRQHKRGEPSVCILYCCAGNSSLFGQGLLRISSCLPLLLMGCCARVCFNASAFDLIWTPGALISFAKIITP